MKKALIVLLIVLVVATGLPVVMSMSGMVACQDCGPAIVVGACTFAVLAAGIIFLLLLVASRSRTQPASTRSRLHSYLLERPPRLA